MVKKVLDTIGEVSNTFDTIKGYVFSVSLMFFGAILLIDPQGKVSEIEGLAPYREMVGWGVGAFGLVFFLAISTRGKFKARMVALIFLTISIGVLWGLGYAFLPKANDAYNLAKKGQLIGGKVTRPGFMPAKDKSYKAVVQLDNGKYRTIRLKSRPGMNQRVRVRYLPDNPKAAVPVEAGDTTMKILAWPGGSGGLWAVLAIGLFALIGVPWNIVSFFKPIAEPE